MGFRNGAFAKVWEVRPKSDTTTLLRISTARKIPNTDPVQYEDDFSGFVSCYGSVVAKKAANLKQGDRIKLGDVDVRNHYDKEKREKYWNPAIFSFEMADSAPATATSKPDVYVDPTDPQPEVDGGDIPDSRLPF